MPINAILAPRMETGEFGLVGIQKSIEHLKAEESERVTENLSPGQMGSPDRGGFAFAMRHKDCSFHDFIGLSYLL